jgi:hypothetical protein
VLDIVVILDTSKKVYVHIIDCYDKQCKCASIQSVHSLSSNLLLINVLLPPPFSRKQIVLKLHQPAHQQRGTSFSCKVTYHCKKILPVAHTSGTLRWKPWNTPLAHTGATTSPNHTHYPHTFTFTHHFIYHSTPYLKKSTHAQHHSCNNLHLQNKNIC